MTDRTELALATKSLTMSGLGGAGKKTLLGSLIYKCGLQLPQVQALESSGASNFADIVAFYQKQDLAQSFYAPSACYTVTETSKPDTAIWIVNAADPDSGEASSNALSSLLTTGSLRPKKKLLIVINKTDLTTVDAEVLRKVVCSFKGIDFKAAETHIIAISALTGTNVLDAPAESPWTDGHNDGSALISMKPLIQLL